MYDEVCWQCSTPFSMTDEKIHVTRPGNTQDWRVREEMSSPPSMCCANDKSDGFHGFPYTYLVLNRYMEVKPFLKPKANT